MLVTSKDKQINNSWKQRRRAKEQKEQLTFKPFAELSAYLFKAKQEEIKK